MTLILLCTSAQYKNGFDPLPLHFNEVVVSVCHQSFNKKIWNNNAQIFIFRYDNLYLRFPT